ncbi:MAG: SPOR domain-containing protein [bacterium]
MKILLLKNVFLYLGLTFFVLSACAPQQKVVTPAKTDKSKNVANFGAMNEDFDPVALNDDDIEFEANSSMYGGFDETVLNSQAITDSVVTGYRVQIFQTTEREEARDVQKDAVLRFDEDVYWVFDPPFYKVRVGDFISWFDAEKLQQLAIKKNYRDAWVVRTKVDVKKATKWLEEF